MENIFANGKLVDEHLLVILIWKLR